MSDHKAQNITERPVSRFWACVSSITIFGLLWTQKMQKTRKWIVLFILYIFVVHIADGLLYASSMDIESLDFVDFWYFSYLDTIESLVEDDMKQEILDDEEIFHI